MPGFVEIEPEQFERSPFKLIGKDWMLIAAEKDGRANAMTAAWGGMGFMWDKNVVFIVIRPQRFTKTLVDGSDTFSLTFFDASYKKMFGYMGTVSGRDEDKIAKSGLTLSYSGDTPYFEEAEAVLICRKLYAQTFRPECFTNREINGRVYPNSDHHTLYIAEVERILGKA